MRILDSLSRWMAYVSAVIMLLLMLLIVADVCGEYLGKWVDWARPITGATEIASFMLIIIVFPALAWAAITDKHVKVDLLMVRFPPRVQAIADSITMLLALGTYVTITWRSVLEAMVVYDTTSRLQLPHTPFYWVMVAGWFVFCLSIVTIVISNITKAVKR